MNIDKNIAPNCRNCKHYHITYDPQTPNGCRLFQIKSRQMPHNLIKAQSGDYCYGFEEKETKRRKESSGY